MRSQPKLLELVEDWSAQAAGLDLVERSGVVRSVTGLVVRAAGPPSAVGDLCELRPSGKAPVQAQVTGFEGNEVLLMCLDGIEGVGPGTPVFNLGSAPRVPAGPGLKGRVIDGLGRPLDGRPLELQETVALSRQAPGPLQREPVSEPLRTGVRVLDGLLTAGKGQRLGIFAGSGVGKSTLLGMITRNTSADVVVIGLIGERGREVRDFIDENLGPQGLKRSVVVTATSDQSPLLRVRAAETATAVAEYFRDQGQDVLLLMDSVTRFAMALREIGLASGEPPATRGYPPSVFATLPKLLERPGLTPRGSITAFYTVLVEGDDLDEPVSDAVRGILDGHLVLSRQLADQGHFPAVDVLQSISRLMNRVVSDEHQQLAAELRRNLAVYQESEDLIRIGAYQAGSSPELDQAVALRPAINEFLQQKVQEEADLASTVASLRRSLHGE